MENQCRAELLAPAGNAEGFYGAVHAGADAIYLAGDRFGARAYAENFSAEELVECIRYGHLMGRKIYLTVNTLLKDGELGQLYDYLAPFYEAGLDAAIVQDLGVLRFLRERFPGLKLHASTQMAICGGYGASLLRDLGVCRIVPARELSLEELKAMKRRSHVEIEAFVHGAMCYCYSGQCLFSSILGGRSGNRGRCAQPCRLPYSVGAEGRRWDDCHPLSLKDMCTIEHIPLLVEAGIDSFKIEGRMKKPEYAAGVTDIYRRYIDRYYELRRKKGIQGAAHAYRVERDDLAALASLYVRSGLQDGYYFRHSGRGMVTLESPAYRESDGNLLAGIRGEHIAEPLKLPVDISATLRIGQPAEVAFSWKDITVRRKGAPVEQAQRQPVTEENVRKQLCKLGDSPFQSAGTSLSLDEDCFYPLKQLNELRRAAVAELEEKVLLARGYGTEAPSGRQAGDCSGIPDAGPARLPGHVPGGRRALVSSREHKGTAGKARPVTFCARTLQQLEALADWFTEEPEGHSGERDSMSGLCRRFYVDSGLLLQERADAMVQCRRLYGRGELFVALPYILREPDGADLEALVRIVEEERMESPSSGEGDCLFRGFLARSMDGLGFAEGRGEGLSCRADASVYVWNKEAAEELSSLAEGFCLPYELKASEQNRLLARIRAEKGPDMSVEKIVYSRIPMMVTANCLKQTMGICHRGKDRDCKGQDAAGDRAPQSGLAVLRDRYHKEFPVLTDCRHCMNIIYNSVPFSLHRTLESLDRGVDLRMDFTIESPSQVRQLLDCFLKGGPYPFAEYTTGHEKRGVE